MKTYIGTPLPGPGPQIVHVVDARGTRSLPMRFDLARHSPDGFNWGYAGSGPAQLAIALCADALQDDARALRIYQSFKFRIVAAWPQGKPWNSTAAEVLRLVDELEQKRKDRERA